MVRIVEFCSIEWSKDYSLGAFAAPQNLDALYLSSDSETCGEEEGLRETKQWALISI